MHSHPNVVDNLNLTQRIRNIIVEQLNITQDTLSNDKAITHYGVSSLNAVIILQALNNAFGIDLELESLLDNFSVNALVELIANALP